MNIQKTWVCLVVLGLTLALVFTACSSTLDETDVIGDEQALSDIDVDELLEDTSLGVVITHVNADSPAEEVDLQKGDVILMISAQEVNSVDGVRSVLEDYQEGDKVQITIRRGDEILVKTVELGAGPNRGYLGAIVCCGGTLLTNREGDPIGFNAVAYVLDVAHDGPAYEAGLEMGDQILSVDGLSFDLDVELSGVFHKYEPDDIVEIKISRGDEIQEITVKLGEHPDDPGVAFLGIHYQMMPAFGFMQRGESPEMRFWFIEPGSQFRRVLPFILDLPPVIPNGYFMTIGGEVIGILITNIEDDGPAARAGLQSQDIITALDSESVDDVDAFVDEIAKMSPGDVVTLTISRSREDEFDVLVTLDEHPDQDGVGYLGIKIGGLVMMQVFNEDCDADDCFSPFEFHFESLPPLDFSYGEDV